MAAAGSMRSMGLEEAVVPNSTQRFQVFGRASPTCFIVFHAIAFVCNASFLAWQLVVGASPQYHFAGVYVFLTIWGLTLQTLYFLVALVTSAALARDLQGVSADWTDRVFLGAARGGTRLLGTSEGVASIPFDEDHGVVVPRARGRGGDALGGAPAPPVTSHNELCCAGPSWSCCDGSPLEHGLGRAARVLEPLTLRLLALRDRLFSLEIAVSLCVSVGFWTLIFPAKSTMHRFETDAGDAVRSSWEHGATLVFVVIELLLVRHRYPRGVMLGACLAGLFGLAYGLWNLLTFDQNGVWPYPGVQDPIERHGDAAVGGVIAGAWVLLAVVWLLGRWLSVGPVWGGGCITASACCCSCCTCCTYECCCCGYCSVAAPTGLAVADDDEWRKQAGGRGGYAVVARDR
ncbi:hypothetical protein FNF27_07027 [Cafeteria roenbergensis]|uniref:Uncharacterized protein n=2 Tax=Cafeteria roenbergensis TaxID=33653 RepID=A0A5A8DVC9_CAFRO|nr:hypothetical protein FNF27_07027 [Cafeteria roenbergensis]